MTTLHANLTRIPVLNEKFELAIYRKDETGRVYPLMRRVVTALEASEVLAILEGAEVTKK